MRCCPAALCRHRDRSPWLLPAGHVALPHAALANTVRQPAIRRIVGIKAASEDPGRGDEQPSQQPAAGGTLEDFSRRRVRWGDRPSALPRISSGASSIKPINPGQPESVIPHLLDRWGLFHSNASDSWGRLLYLYFNWRQDTSKDLFLILSLFSTFVLLGGSTRRWLIDSEEERHAATGFWNDVYQVCQWVFGQEFPAASSPLTQQVFAVVTAMMGLCVFALVLALVEQVVLEGMEANVKRGSRVYETGHHLILSWCVSQRDVEVVRKILQQICVAYKPEGGTQVVVLTQRSKLEMEGMFWRSLPAAKRFGTQIIFRQGSALVPSDLKMVGACRAAATVIVSDQSRSAAEADAQSVRCAILLDELDMAGADRDDNRDCRMSSSSSSTKHTRAAKAGISADSDVLMGHGLDLSLTGRQVVVELKTSNALPLLKYACSNRIIALPTSQLNAQRLAKMVKRPVISIVSQQLFNFENGVSTYVHYYPHLVGQRFGELAFLFPDGVVLGLVDRITGHARMAPSKDYIISSSQALVAIRPTTIASHAYHPLMQPPNMAQLLHAEGNDVCRWVRRQDRPTYLKEQLVVTAAPSASSSAATVDSYEGFAPAPEWSKSEVSQVEALRQQVEASSFCADGQLDSASQGVGASSSAGCNSNSSLQNNIVLADIGSNMDATSMFALSKLASASKLATVDILAGRMRQKHTTEATAETVAPHSTVAGSSVAMQPPDFASNSSLSRRSSKADSRPYSQGGGVRNSSRSIPKKTPVALKTDDWPVLSGRQHRAYHYAKGWHLPGMACKSKQLLEYQQKYGLPGRPILAAMTASTSAGNNDTVTSAMSVTQQAALAASQLLVPVEYLQVDEGPERVLVLGWGPNSLMSDLIKELDHGLSALPGGSEVVFANTHHADDSLGVVLQQISLEYIKVRHVRANPLQRSSLAAKLDMSTFRCAVVLCDELWVDPDSNDGNGIDGVDEPSVLRQDSLVMVSQLNVRKLLEDSRRPPINIICQKIATEGLTRFEDRNRLPLGISINLNSFSAKLLSQIAANPLMLYPVTRLGEDAQLTIVDSSAYAGLGEAINWWQLVARCQEVGDVLIGYYAIPDHMDEPLNTVVDPLGMEERCRPRVWTTGGGRLKFIVLRGHDNHQHGSSSGSVDDMELENTQQAHWVRKSSGGSTAGSSPSSSNHDSSDHA